MSLSPEKKRRVWEVLRISDIKDIKYIKISKSDIKDIKDISDIKDIKRMGREGDLAPVPWGAADYLSRRPSSSPPSSPAEAPEPGLDAHSKHGGNGARASSK